MIRFYLVALMLSAFLFMSGTLDLNELFDYDGLPRPVYIMKDNTGGNAITNAAATLGRVLFYDKKLSANNLVACASCHIQAFAFSDTTTASTGLNGGQTGRHSMRLVNTRFADEVQFFWNKRAISLEFQVTQPIQDHIEMGFSGDDGDPTFSDLLVRLDSIDYYGDLFLFAFGDAGITEERIQLALAQFVRSIQSFDSKFDIGRAMVRNNNPVFPNFTDQENLGKTLFLSAPATGGAGCQRCHRAPEFDIDPNSLNNNIVAVIGDTSGLDLTNTRSPSLRDLINPDGVLNGPLMHDGSLSSLEEVIDHYNNIVRDPDNDNLDNRLAGPPPRNGVPLNLTETEKEALVAFLMTLTGADMYTAEQWSDPFDALGNLDWVPFISTSIQLADDGISLFYNSTTDYIGISRVSGTYTVRILDEDLVEYQNISVEDDHIIDLNDVPSGLFFIELINTGDSSIALTKIIKE